MKQDIKLSYLISFLESQGMTITSYQTDQLKKYHDLLASWQKKMNLISKGDTFFIYERHFITSFYYVFLMQNYIKINNNILDMGSGAGFPGGILSIIFPDSNITLVDSSRKKTLFLNQLKKDLNLINIKIINERLDKICDEQNIKYDFVVARALASVPELISWSMKFLKEEGELYAIKGIDFQSEINNHENRYEKIQTIPILQTWINKFPNLNDKVFIHWKNQ